METGASGRSGVLPPEKPLRIDEGASGLPDVWMGALAARASTASTVRCGGWVIASLDGARAVHAGSSSSGATCRGVLGCGAILGHVKGIQRLPDGIGSPLLDGCGNFMFTVALGRPREVGTVGGAIR
jgi:hypothetical protein